MNDSPVNISVDGDEGLGRTKDGLIVPKSYVVKKEHWFKDEWKRIARWARQLRRDHDIDFMFSCIACEREGRAGLVQITTDEDGYLLLTCGCKERKVVL